MQRHQWLACPECLVSYPAPTHLASSSSLTAHPNNLKRPLNSHCRGEEIEAAPAPKLVQPLRSRPGVRCPPLEETFEHLVSNPDPCKCLPSPQGSAHRNTAWPKQDHDILSFLEAARPSPGSLCPGHSRGSPESFRRNRTGRRILLKPGACSRSSVGRLQANPGSFQHPPCLFFGTSRLLADLREKASF